MSDKDKSVKKSPNLRFPRFQGEWKTNNFGYLASFKTTNSFSRENLNYENGTVKNIHYGDIHTKFQTLCDVTKENVPFVNDEINLVRISNESFCKEGDVIFADASEDLNDVGKSIELINLNNEKVLSGLHTLLARPNENIFEKGFLGYLLKSKSARLQIQKESQGSKVLSINVGRLSKIDISYPIKEEQKRIANFFSLLDEKILTQKKTITQNQSLMQFLRDSLISGKHHFDLNFPERKRKKIKDVLTIGTGKDYKHLSSGNVPVYGTGGIIEFVDSALFDGETVCIGRKGTINKPLYFQGKIWTVDTLFYTHSFVDCIPRFIFYLFQTINWLEYNEASGVPSLSKSTIEKILIDLPSIEEQSKIIEILDSLQNKITNEQRTLALFEQQKKYFLQNLFI